MEISKEMIAAAWGAWHSRHGGKLGPGPAFVEAIEAAFSKVPPVDAASTRAKALWDAIDIIEIEAHNLSFQPARLQNPQIASRHFIRKIRKRMPVDTGEIRNDDP